jgi:2-methylcitrate dehydratase
MRGFVGPADVLRNPQAIFCLFEPPQERDAGPFDLRLGAAGGDFAVMGMHFKLGLYEHQSAGAIAGLIDLLAANPGLLGDAENIRRLRIAIYQPALGIIGDPAKRDPRTRQSADHSMLYIIATLLRKALESKQASWESLMLMPADYDDAALFHPLTRALMQRIEFVHGGAEYDRRYPDGIPTSLEIEHVQLGTLASGLVMYPEGHARNTSGNLERLLARKFQRLASLGVADPAALYERLTCLADKSAQQIRELYAFKLDGV